MVKSAAVRISLPNHVEHGVFTMKIPACTRAVACVLAVAVAPMEAVAQESREKPADRDTSRVESVGELFSARSLMRPIRITAADLAATGTPVNSIAVTIPSVAPAGSANVRFRVTVQ